MKKLLLFIILSTQLTWAQKIEYKEGDFIFQNINCGPLCEAINEVTHGYNGINFNHIGMVIEHEGTLQVIEATWPEVCITPLDKFTSKNVEAQYVGRLKTEYQELISKAKEFSIAQLGIPYDVNYLMNNNKYYCSELIYDAFKSANDNTEVFPLFPMTYKSKTTKEFFPVWLDYFKKLNQEVPEGLPGCNPAGMSLDNKIVILGKI